jgi:uncharacterized protein (DUF1810 family)
MSSDAPDPFDLQRFVKAQEENYSQALAELKRGRKSSHWMWYVFPQFAGLGHSLTTQFYAIKSAGEAEAYLLHPVLGQRLVECSEALLNIEGRTVSEILGFPDDLKLKSSITLFSALAENDSVFDQVLRKYFGGYSDDRTLELLATAS